MGWLTYSRAKVAKRGTKDNTFAQCRHSDLASYAPAGSSLACKEGISTRSWSPEAS